MQPEHPSGPLTRGGLRVCAHLCATCIYRPGNLMQLRPGRVRGMIRDSLRADSFIVCHRTLPEYPSSVEPAVCRGFYDAHRQDSLGCRLAALVGVIDVEPDA